MRTTLDATGASDIFDLPARAYVSLTGTWEGTAALQIRDSNGDFVNAQTFTENAAVQWDGLPRTTARWYFTRTSGTVVADIFAP